MNLIQLVVVTRHTAQEFVRKTLLGRSLPFLRQQKSIRLNVVAENSGARARGLGDLYNTFLQPKYAGDVLLFVHDDVWLNDWLLASRLSEAMRYFDVVGLAGNMDPDWSQPSWALQFDGQLHSLGWQDTKRLSGVVAHLVAGKLSVQRYGPAPKACQLLDGLFLAVNAERALKVEARFDPQFTFHLYDLDFCRSCWAKGLRLGTWPIAATHGSGGRFGTPAWTTAARKYLDKWNNQTQRV